MKTYSTMPQHPTIHPVILSTFTAEGLTREEALTQPRQAEVILRHDPFAASPYIITLSSPSFAFEGSGTPMHGDHAWDFATFNQAQAWFDELFDANADMIIERQQPPKRERDNATFPWKVGDPAILRRLIPYDIWLARTRSRLDKAAANSKTTVLSERQHSMATLRKGESCLSFGSFSQDAPANGLRDRLQGGESFFSFGN